MISFDEAVELVRSVATPMGTEIVALSEAAGRVLAEPVIARIDSPRSDVSAMDGYALRGDVGTVPASFKIEGVSLPGAGWPGELRAGACVRIFTGAPIPQQADRIVIQEDVRAEDGLLIVDERPPRGLYIRGRGSDFNMGEQLLAAGRRLDPRAIVAAGAADLAELKLFCRPRLAIISTGDELVEPGTASSQPDAIPESVSLGVAALACEWGAKCEERTRVPDDLASLQDAAAAALGVADVIVVTGGASVGDRDFGKAMFEPFGLELAFSAIAMKPGKPTWLGRAQERTVLGLPGNPTSALVTARLLLAPLLAAMTEQPFERALCWRQAQLATRLEDCGSRETFHRAKLVHGQAEILSFQESSAQKALAAADLLVRQRAGMPALEPGDLVDVLDF